MASHLYQELGVEKLGVLAFCVNTHVGLKLAAEPTVSALACVTPTLIGGHAQPEPEMALDVQCPVMMLAAKYDQMEIIQSVRLFAGCTLGPAPLLPLV